MKAKEREAMRKRANFWLGYTVATIDDICGFVEGEITRERSRASAARREQDEARARRLADADAKMIERAKGAKRI